MNYEDYQHILFERRGPHILWMTLNRPAQLNAADARLHTELVKATGRLADPSDLAYSEDHLTDSDALNTAIDELLTAKPHLKKPTAPSGDVGQGNRGTAEVPVSLLGILRNIV